jgi:IS5 family transposase
VGPVPEDTPRLRWANLIHPATRHRLLDHVVALAQSRKITRGRPRRIAGTMVATTIHHPTDSTLRYDGVRVLRRPLTNAKSMVQEAPPLARPACRARPRSAKRQRTRSMEAARPRGPAAADRMPPASQRLLDITRTPVPHAQRVGAVLQTHATPQRQKRRDTLERMVPLMQPVSAQPTRRGLQGEAVPAAEKVVRLFVPHPAIIRTGKPGKPTAFGRVIGLDEVEGGLLSRYAVLEGHPPADAQLPPSLDHHRRLCHRSPRLLTGDRGVHFTATERYATMQGVKQGVVPKPGATSAKRRAHAQPRWFRRGRDWRAGIEGRS